MPTKSELRQALLNKRRTISAVARAAAANAAMRIFIDTPLFQQSQHIACYLPLTDEFDSLPIIQQIWQHHKNCYLPVLSQQAEKSLQFRRYEAQSVMQINRFKIPEPVDTLEIAVQQLDIILLPLVGFDLHGNRLGMGAGFYDRTLSVLRGQTKTCQLIGLAYEIQRVDQLPHDAWDIPLDGVITEKSMSQMPHK